MRSLNPNVCGYGYGVVYFYIFGGLIFHSKRVKRLCMKEKCDVNGCDLKNDFCLEYDDVSRVVQRV